MPEFLKSALQASSCVPSAASVVNGFDVRQAQSAPQLSAIRELFQEYAQSLGFSLCFQNFDKEFASLPGDYAPPEGRLLLASHDGAPAGCVALHRLNPDICEMKRLYVRPQFRRKGLGRALAERIIADARQLGCKKLRLDTVEPRMQAAVLMYRQLGFGEIASYRENPIEGALYMELKL